MSHSETMMLFWFSVELFSLVSKDRWNIWACELLHMSWPAIFDFISHSPEWTEWLKEQMCSCSLLLLRRCVGQSRAALWAHPGWNHVWWWSQRWQDWCASSLFWTEMCCCGFWGLHQLGLDSRRGWKCGVTVLRCRKGGVNENVKSPSDRDTHRKAEILKVVLG